jgi:3-oxoacyl-[acyl-carrier protein] reductase
MNQLDLKGRHAIVTGGAAGLGLAITQRFLASGAQVTWWDRDAATMAAAQQALGALAGKVQTVVVDVSEHASVVDAVRQTVASRPVVYALVNCAGITGPNVKVWDYPPEQWLQVMQVNLNGLFYCCREVVPLMRARNAGRIVNIASVAGKDGNPNASAYSASKAAVIALTKSLGKELAKSNVLVNCVTPAVADTDILKQMSEAHVAFMLGKIPMGRFVKIDEIAALVAWLASADCSFTTGGVFDITGGRSTY